METAPRGAMSMVEATMAPHMASSWTATGAPIFQALRRMSPSKTGFSLRSRRSRLLEMQHRQVMTRLITAQARAVPIPAPRTPYRGMNRALKIMSRTHMTELRMLGVTMSPLHCKKAEVREFSWEKGSIRAKTRK